MGVNYGACVRDIVEVFTAVVYINVIFESFHPIFTLASWFGFIALQFSSDKSYGSDLESS